MKRKAFTMLEFVFVLIVIGILGVLSMPNFDYNPTQQAAQQIANHIRYTQHLAMMDDRYAPGQPLWFREKWQIRFRRNSGTSGYAIFSDTNRQANIDAGEAAVDPATGRPLDGFNGNNDLDLTAKYNILGTDAGIVQTCFTADGSLVTANRGVFAFDNLGRPYSAVSNVVTAQQGLMNANCDLQITSQDGDIARVRVHPETGYVCVLNAAGNACI